MYKTIITDNYILITSDEEIKSGDWQLDTKNRLSRFSTISMNLYGESYKKVIAHLPINDSANLRGVPLLPPLPSGEDDVEKLSWEYTFNKFGEVDDFYDTQEGYIEGWKKHSEKYRFSEEDVKKAIVMATTSKYDHKLEFHSQEEIIQSLSQPKMPIAFKCEMIKFEVDMGLGEECIEYSEYPKIINGVLQGEWIY
jgi:hypothetical protein